MSFEDQEIVCLNECTFDYDTGICLSCGRPPIVIESPGRLYDDPFATLRDDPAFGRMIDPSGGKKTTS
jgi:hypothetical protein